MGVCEDGAVFGSVSGGCVEAAVIESALRSLKSGKAEMLDFGALSDASVWEVGLSCGGRIRVWVDPCAAQGTAWNTAAERVISDRPTVLATRYEPHALWLWPPRDEIESNHAPAELQIVAKQALESKRSAEVQIEGESWFLHVLPMRERMIIVGAVHIAIPLVMLAQVLGFETVVIEPRPGLATSDRFITQPDAMVVEWPQRALADLDLNRETYAVMLTHDPKIDDDAIEIFLRSDVAYIGALGSHTTHEKRIASFRARGFSDEELARIHGPVGLKIGARSPEEIALSIMAEIVQVRNASR